MRAPATLKYAVTLALGFMLGLLLAPTSFRLQWEESPELKGLRGKNCVCDEKAEELKVLARIGRYLAPNGTTTSTTSRGKAPPTAKPESDVLLKEFMYPNNGTYVLDRKRQEYKPGSQFQPSLLSEEYLYKKMVFVGVLTQQSYLPTRAKYLYETWGKEVDGLVFFVGEDCVVPPDLAYLPVVKLAGIPDNVYPPLKKTFAVMRYMYDNYLNQFNWFIRADDDVYMRTKQLKELLGNMLPYEKVYLGRAGTGRRDDLDRLDLLPHERYCMGGPGIILSMGALRELGPHLTNCLNAGQ